LLATCFFSAVSFAQSLYDEELLAVKRIFSDAENAALSREYTGITTGKGVISDLFPLRSTGVSTAPVLEAAQRFLSTLTPEQLIRTHFSIGDSEWRKWSNVDNGIYVRQGVSLEEMTEPQKAAAIGLMSSSLSAQGLDLSFNIMKTDQTLLEINDNLFIYGEEKYFFTINGCSVGERTVGLATGWPPPGHQLFRAGRPGSRDTHVHGRRAGRYAYREVCWQRDLAVRTEHGSCVAAIFE
jgi:hypothetical protein